MKYHKDPLLHIWYNPGHTRSEATRETAEEKVSVLVKNFFQLVLVIEHVMKIEFQPGTATLVLVCYCEATTDTVRDLVEQNKLTKFLDVTPIPQEESKLLGTLSEELGGSGELHEKLVDFCLEQLELGAAATASKRAEKAQAQLPQKFQDAGTPVRIKATPRWQKVAETFPKLLESTTISFLEDTPNPDMKKVVCLKASKVNYELKRTDYSTTSHRWNCCNSGAKAPYWHVCNRVKKRKFFFGGEEEEKEEEEEEEEVFSV